MGAEKGDEEVEQGFISQEMFNINVLHLATMSSDQFHWLCGTRHMSDDLGFEQKIEHRAMCGLLGSARQRVIYVDDDLTVALTTAVWSLFETLQSPTFANAVSPINALRKLRFLVWYYTPHGVASWYDEESESSRPPQFASSQLDRKAERCNDDMWAYLTRLCGGALIAQNEAEWLRDLRRQEWKSARRAGE